MQMQMSMINNLSRKHTKIDTHQGSDIHLSPRELRSLRAESGDKNVLSNGKNSSIRNSNRLGLKVDKEFHNNIKRMGTAATGNRNQYQSIFRAANFLGLFPVSGLFTSSNKRKDGEQVERGAADGIQFSPASWRLLATFVFIVAVLLLEGMGLIHMLIATDHTYGNSHVHFVTYRHGTIASDLAPVLHYGATVASVILLINAARRFPKTAKLWQQAEEMEESMKLSIKDNIKNVDGSGHSTNCPSVGSVLIVCAIVASALIQTTIGTLTSVVINSKLSNSTKSEENELDAVEDWLQKYMLGSHSFVSAITDGETFWSGLAIFIVSNYTVIVWIVVDLILILSARNISKSSSLLNKDITMTLHQHAETEGAVTIDYEPISYIRQRHWNICRLVHHLDASTSGLYLCFFITNIFFMWNHLISLASPPVDLYLYTIYQAWSLFRQILRFSLVTRYAVSVSKELQKPLRQVMDLPSAHYEKESKRLQEQSSLSYNGFNAGPFFRLDEKNISVGILLLLGTFWMMFQFQRQQIENNNTAIIMTKHASDSNNQIESEGEQNEAPNTRPSFEFQIIDKPALSLFEPHGMTMIFRPSKTEMEALAGGKNPARPSYLNIFQW